MNTKGMKGTNLTTTRQLKRTRPKTRILLLRNRSYRNPSSLSPKTVVRFLPIMMFAQNQKSVVFKKTLIAAKKHPFLVRFCHKFNLLELLDLLPTWYEKLWLRSSICSSAWTWFSSCAILVTSKICSVLKVSSSLRTLNPENLTTTCSSKSPLSAFNPMSCSPFSYSFYLCSLWSLVCQLATWLTCSYSTRISRRSFTMKSSRLERSFSSRQHLRSIQKMQSCMENTSRSLR